MEASCVPARTNFLFLDQLDPDAIPRVREIRPQSLYTEPYVNESMVTNEQ